METLPIKSHGRFFIGGWRTARVLFYRAVRTSYGYLIAPKSSGEDDKRQEYLLNIILAISIIFLAILLSIIVIEWINLDKDYGGVHPAVFLIITLFYCSLFVLSKKGRFTMASFILVGFYLVGAIYSGWAFGESLPATLLTNALVIVTATILLGSRIGIYITALVVALMFALGIHEQVAIGVPDWHGQAISISDIAGYAIMFLFISFISWLSNREIENSLARARQSEKMLAEERNSLERKVSLRTEELVSMQQAKERELEHAANFGNLSRGLVHDLMNPLTSITLYIESLAKGNSDVKETGEVLAKTIAASNRMKSFISSIQHASLSSSKDRTASLSEELSIVIDLLAYKARMSGVAILIDRNDTATLNAEPIRINQLLLNLISNAIDACAINSDKRGSASQNEVRVEITSDKSQAIVKISDTGCGIPEKHANDVFNKSFTTKTGGTGLGLMTAKNIVEKDLRGSINIESRKSGGSLCTIIIPIASNVKSK